MADFIDIKVEGEDKILAALDYAEQRLHSRTRDHVNDLSRFVTAHLAATVPVYDSYILRHIDREPSRWVPGGAGGGGAWEGMAGIRRGTSLHPLYTEFGTGIYAGRGRKRLIRARYDRAQASVIATGNRRLSRRAGGVLTFQKHGEPRRFRYWVSGQKGQHYFYFTWLDLNIYAAARILTGEMFRRA